MTAKAAPSASACRSDVSKMTQVPDVGQTSEDIVSVIESLKKKVAANRSISVQEKVEENKQQMAVMTNQLYDFAISGSNNAIHGDKHVDLLTKRQQDAISMLSSAHLENDSNGHEEDSGASTAVLLGANFGVKSSIRPVRLREVEKIPPYTTWVFLHRNQRMTEDQSVVGRRRIYYDQSGGEALICSDSEEELVEDEEDKKEFVEYEDYILRMTIHEVGLSDSVLDSLAQCFSRKPSEVKARYEVLSKGEKSAKCSKMGVNEDDQRTGGALVDKDLDAALDSFDNLFCRRCLVFDCRLHGCSQDLVFPAEKPLPWSPPDEKEPCSSHCYRLVPTSECVATASSSKHDGSGGKPILSSSSTGVQLSPNKKAVGSSGKTRSKSNRSDAESSDSDQHSTSPSKGKSGAKGGIQKRNSKRVAERVLVCMKKKQKKVVASDSNSVGSGRLWPRDMKLRSNSRKDNEDTSSSSQKNTTHMGRKSRRKESLVDRSKKLLPIEGQGDEEFEEIIKELPSNGSDEKEEFVDENIYKHEDSKPWSIIEKSLFAKGVEIFGRNSCLIARNLLTGMKTCSEIFQYMNFSENKLLCREGDGTNSICEGNSKASQGGELRTRSRFIRRKGKVRRLKYTWKSAAYHSIRKRITEGKNQPCRQYNPCGCQTACGKECTCLLNGTCCEKYCGCPKNCKNRFRGCHCAKSQCRSRQCPCFAANRECDPDVCRNCWVSCGDGTLGGPSQGGDNYECRNMKLLLKQQQKVLLGRSDVSGWGAFLKNSVSKHEYLGEYTGELISHREADKRGKIYDRENSSFLFNLNNQFVLDAYRKGDKLKFANHSPGPNCYAKVIMVAGDHRVAIYAKERINSGEELFYDYQYEPDHCPAWARKPEAPGARKDEAGSSHGRAKKLA